MDSCNSIGKYGRNSKAQTWGPIIAGRPKIPVSKLTELFGVTVDESRRQVLAAWQLGRTLIFPVSRQV